MEIYQITYQEYVAFMQRLKGEIELIINITPDNSRKMMAIKIASMIEKTIATAQAEINLPSEELMNIVSRVKELKTCGSTPIPEVMEALNRSLDLLNSAANVLMRITDDSYVTNAVGHLKSLTV